MIRLIKENRSFILFLTLMFVFRSTFADWNTVPTGSMKPTIVEGDRILVNKIAYDLQVPFTGISLLKISDPKRGDIAVFDSKVANKRLVKRVIALPGDTVALVDNTLIINGTSLNYEADITLNDKRYETEHLFDVKHLIQTGVHGSNLSNFSEVTVPHDSYLMLGDNRDNSADSRVIGFVPRSEFVGRTRQVVLSLDYDNHYIPRKERFFHTL